LNSTEKIQQPLPLNTRQKLLKLRKRKKRNADKRQQRPQQKKKRPQERGLYGLQKNPTKGSSHLMIKMHNLLPQFNWNILGEKQNNLALYLLMT
jgi:hypothetical protein